MEQESAYPYEHEELFVNEPPRAEKGLTKREWYAGLAMQGMCSRHANCDHPDVIPKITSSAFEIADAMIEKSKEK